MIGLGVCQRGGSMRSKPLLERPQSDKEGRCVPSARALHVPGALSLVRGAEADATSKMKPGLY